MCKHMSVKISNGLEVFFTTISHTVMSHIEVGEFVLLQPAIKRECFATCFTHKVKFPVYIRVLIQSRLCSKTFATITTKLDVVFRTMVFVQGFDTFAGGITDLTMNFPELLILFLQDIAFYRYSVRLFLFVR